MVGIVGMSDGDSRQRVALIQGTDHRTYVADLTQDFGTQRTPGDNRDTEATNDYQETVQQIRKSILVLQFFQHFGYLSATCPETFFGAWSIRRVRPGVSRRSNPGEL
jgi:hypothetical protein